ncbi:hypothetical protein TNCV_4062211 [Trichonephila clavipes]|nr:hypothetical protein TNCV_4062211 [Trichonephila clavipes]
MAPEPASPPQTAARSPTGKLWPKTVHQPLLDGRSTDPPGREPATICVGNENNWKRPFIFEETVCQFEHSLTVKSCIQVSRKKIFNVASVASKNAMTEAADEVRKLKNTSDVAECGV